MDNKTDAELQVPFSAGTNRPKLNAPVNSCDCHHHIYDSRFPFPPGAWVLPDATVDGYRLYQKRIGLTRNVVVTPSSYGTDNRCTLDAMAKLGPNARGVAVVAPEIPDGELRRMADLGVRGLRFNLAVGKVTSVDMIEPLARRIADLGWHVQINMPGDSIMQFETLLNRLPTGIVFDHMARIPYPAGAEHPAFRLICRLLDKGRAWVKLSGVYLTSKAGPPRYEDAGKLAQTFIRYAPERILWGGDWPHPSLQAEKKAMPDDAQLFDLLGEWAPEEAIRQKILVDNPAIVYGFPR